LDDGKMPPFIKWIRGGFMKVNKKGKYYGWEDEFSSGW
jgi:hypothetical protein